ECKRIRIVVDAVATADHHSVAGAIREPKTRRERSGAKVVAAILRHAADATDQHLVVLVVEAFQTARRPGSHREMVPADAERRGEGAADLPLVLDECAELPVAASCLVVLERNASSRDRRRQSKD